MRVQNKSWNPFRRTGRRRAPEAPRETAAPDKYFSVDELSKGFSFPETVNTPNYQTIDDLLSSTPAKPVSKQEKTQAVPRTFTVDELFDNVTDDSSKQGNPPEKFSSAPPLPKKQSVPVPQSSPQTLTSEELRSAIREKQAKIDRLRHSYSEIETRLLDVERRLDEGGDNPALRNQYKDLLQKQNECGDAISAAKDAWHDLNREYKFRTFPQDSAPSTGQETSSSATEQTPPSPPPPSRLQKESADAFQKLVTALESRSNSVRTKGNEVFQKLRVGLVQYNNAARQFSNSIKALQSGLSRRGKALLKRDIEEVQSFKQVAQNMLQNFGIKMPSSK